MRVQAVLGCVCWHRGRESREKARERGVGGRRRANELLTGYYRGRDIMHICSQNIQRDFKYYIDGWDRAWQDWISLETDQKWDTCWSSSMQISMFITECLPFKVTETERGDVFVCILFFTHKVKKCFIQCIARITWCQTKEVLFKVTVEVIKMQICKTDMQRESLKVTDSHSLNPSPKHHLSSRA